MEKSLVTDAMGQYVSVELLAKSSKITALGFYSQITDVCLNSFTSPLHVLNLCLSIVIFIWGLHISQNFLLRHVGSSLDFAETRTPPLSSSPLDAHISAAYTNDVSLSITSDTASFRKRQLVLQLVWVCCDEHVLYNQILAGGAI